MSEKIPSARRAKSDLVATLGKFIKSSFIAGLMALLPLLLTLYILEFIVSSFDHWMSELPLFIRPAAIPGAGLLSMLLLILLVGAVARNIIGKSVFRYFDALVNRIPVIKSLYGLLRQISEVFLGANASGFKHVVLVEWPRRECWTIAFVASETKGILRAQIPGDGRPRYLNLFVPTTPNPTSGFFFIVPESEVVSLSISIDQAFKTIVSGGVLSPDEIIAPQPVAIEPVASGEEQ